MTDIEIASKADIKPVVEIAKKLNLSADDLELYGKFKAKLPLNLIDEKQLAKNKLILVTAITPTPSGEGKTTALIGLTDGLNKIGKQATAVLREPSLGPVFGIKGGAAGGGYSQVIPMEDINLHFTGDFSAIEKANNLLSAVIDNHVHHGNALNLDLRTVTWKRVMDMNDRALRQVVSGLGGKTGGVPSETGFNITAASEIMAILCIAADREDLKKRLGSIYVGDTFDKKPVYASQLNVVDAMAILLKDAIKPNLVQTLEGNPAIIHGGPFANIAQGTNSVLATKTGLSLSEFVVTEAGFGADLGAEKFLDIKARNMGVDPSLVMIVATIKALKFHGGQPLADLSTSNTEALEKGFINLQKHVENMHKFNLPALVCLNKFPTDSDEEIKKFGELCAHHGIPFSLSEGWAKGGEGTKELAKKAVDIIDAIEVHTPVKYAYDVADNIDAKINKVAKSIYGASAVSYSPKAKRELKKITANGWDDNLICVAKTQKSFSDKDALGGIPQDFTLEIRDIEYALGAGFVVPVAGAIMRMPGLPKKPASEGMTIDNNGKISGLS